MRKTTNYGLSLYDKEDKMSITAEENSLNANMKIIDNTLKEKANDKDIPTKVSELTNDIGFITDYTESDPTVPSHVKGITTTDISNWNNKADVEDIPTVPTKVSELENDKNYISSIPSEYVTDAELNNKNYATESFVTNKIAEAELNGGEVDLSGLATKDELASKVDKVKGKSLVDDTEIERLKTVTNYDDTTLKNQINSKADKTDIPTVPTNISSFTNDSGYLTSIPSEYVTETELNAKGYLTSVPSEYVTDSELNAKGYLTDVPSDYKTKAENDSLYQTKGNYLTSYTETDPTVPSHVKSIKSTDISNWNSKSTFSGNYNDLTNKPTIPTVPSNISAFNNDIGYLTEITEEIKTEIVQMVIESLGGNPVFGYVDKNNNIIMSGDIPDGTYTVVYEMEDGGTITIGNLVLDNTVEYSITNNLTNCTNSNNATTIVEGESYSATITANSGYELKSVSVTMGGSAVSVSGGNIDISSVTGDIVITAVAEEKVVTPTYTNLANPSDANWKEGKRLNSSYNEVDAQGMVTTNFIPASKSTDSSNPTKIYIKGLTFGNTSNERVCQYIDQSTPNNAIVSTVNADLFSRSGDVTIVTLSGSAVMANSTLVRICGTLTGNSEDVIITVNEEIA